MKIDEKKNYQIAILLCNHNGSGDKECEMNYVGNGDYKCPECGDIYHDWEYDEDDDENISVFDAALIWRSNGEDKDYTFGYTESELRRALR